MSDESLAIPVQPPDELKPSSEEVIRKVILDKLDELGYGYDFVQYYKGALHAIEDHDNPDRVSQAAHSMREVIDKLKKAGYTLLDQDTKDAIKDGKVPNKNKVCLQTLFEINSSTSNRMTRAIFNLDSVFGQFFIKVCHHSTDKDCLEIMGKFKIKELEESGSEKPKERSEVAEEVKELSGSVKSKYETIIELSGEKRITKSVFRKVVEFFELFLYEEIIQYL
jgi:hypothetical protein